MRGGQIGVRSHEIHRCDFAVLFFYLRPAGSGRNSKWFAACTEQMVARAMARALDHTSDGSEK